MQDVGIMNPAPYVGRCMRYINGDTRHRLPERVGQEVEVLAVYGTGQVYVEFPTDAYRCVVAPTNLQPLSVPTWSLPEPYLPRPIAPGTETLVKPDPSPKNPNPKDAIGSSKLPLHLWPASATAYGALALLDGALKYGRSNYRGTPVRASIYYDAADRHLKKWMEGRDNDLDSGLPELSHALACLAILIDAQTHGTLIDDRMFVPEGSKGFLGLMDELSPHVTRLQALHADKTPQHFTKDSNAI